jgi:K+-sensing histidine kinase KdpD
MTMHGDMAMAGIQLSDLIHISEWVMVFSVVVTFLGIGLLGMLAAKSVGLMLTMVVGISVICSLIGVGVIAWLMMGRALRNLVTNAIRHTPSDGVVDVLAEMQGGMACVSVSDACGGIPPGCQFLIRLPVARPGVPAAAGLASTSRRVSPALDVMT